jgi:NAD(P)-dependent dehydrogenase (short-subunit alcohol dehydrogenase family)
MATTRYPDSFQNIKSDKLRIIPFDVASKTGREKIVQSVSKNCPNGLDCLVNNAGYSLAGPLEALTDEQIRDQFEVNLFAPLLLIRDLLPALRVAKGKVINISSALGFVGMPMQSLYAASKFALEGLSESLSYELDSHGVQVIIVEPGGFRTRFAENTQWPDNGIATPTPLYNQQLQGYKTFFLRSSTQGEGNDPAQVANLIVRLASQQSVPLRARVGADAHALYFLRHFLPQKMADRVLRRISHQILDTR